MSNPRSRHRSYTYAQFVAATSLLSSAALIGCEELKTQSSTETSSISTPDPTPALTLDASIIQDDAQAFRDHIESGTPVNTKNAMGDTPLHIAAALGRSDAVAQLIEAGAELEATNSSGVTPLFNAAFFCHTDALQSLIDAGADKHPTDQFGTPILNIIETPWDEIRPIYEMVYSSIGLPFDESRIEAARPGIASMLRE